MHGWIKKDPNVILRTFCCSSISPSLFLFDWIGLVGYETKDPLTVKCQLNVFEKIERRQSNSSNNSNNVYLLLNNCSEANHLMNYTICSAFGKHNVRQASECDIKINWCWNENDGESAFVVSRFSKGVRDTHIHTHHIAMGKSRSDLLWPIDFFGGIIGHWNLRNDVKLYVPILVANLWNRYRVAKQESCDIWIQSVYTSPFPMHSIRTIRRTWPTF